jgi:hypothetical protein
MSICVECGEDMDRVHSCSGVAVVLNGDVYARVRYGDEVLARGLELGDCHDCNARPGGYHHAFCDVEQCPRCGEQFIGCLCDETPLEGSPRGE